MRTRHARPAIGAVLFAVAACRGSVAGQSAPITVRTSQQVIRVTPRYQGDLVRVEGTAPASAEIVLQLTSPTEEVASSQKGRVGPFWLSVHQVRFRNVPRMFKVKSTAPLDDILPDSELVAWRLGRVGLKASMEVEDGVDRNLYLDELILIREREQRFGFVGDGVRREGNSYAASFFWPPDGPTGLYRVEAYAVERGRVVGTAQTWVDVRAVGVEAWIRDLASKHGILYGLFSVGLAAVAGLVVSFLFGGWRKADSSPAPPRDVSARTAG